MRRRSILSCVALAAMVVAPVAGAASARAATSATIYVATTTGADGTTCGTAASPCRTVGKGAAQAIATAADDMTVQIAAGTYAEKVAVGTVPTGKALHLVGAGASSTTIDAQQTGTVASVVAGTLTVDQLTFTGGSSTNFGGGLIAGTGANLTITDSVVTGNSAANFGGGVASYGTLRVVRSTISNNTAKTHGGGLSSESGTLAITDSTVSGNSAPTGGGVNTRAATTVTRSTISGNSASQGGGNNGSGLLSAGAAVDLVDSTVSGNVGTASLVLSGGTSTIMGSTLSADTSGVLLVLNALGTATVSSSVLSNVGATCSGVVTDGGANVTSDTSCGWGTGNGSRVSSVAAIGLQPLAANGSTGPKTMAITAGSSAHLVVPTGDCSATDERGQPRPGGGSGAPACDAGAFELRYTPLSAIYVASSGEDVGGCGAQATPCRTVQQGVDEARFASVDDVTVHIAAGTYAEKVNAGTWPEGKSLTLSGAGADDTTIDANQTGAVLRVAGGAVRVEDLTLTGGSSPFGGGIDSDGDLTVTDAVITGNASQGDGGGIFADSGSVTVTRSTISNNRALSYGGGIAAEGGAKLLVSTSTLSANTGNFGSAVFAGGIQNGIATSTLAGNDGAGTVYVLSGRTVTITDTTLHAASNDELVGGADPTAQAVVAHSVLSDADAISCLGITAVDGGHNVVSDDSCGFDDSNGSVSSSGAIGLQPLAANGSSGPQTMAIGAASSAHLLVPAADCAAVDERDQPRPGGGAGAAFCDAGAYELQLNSLSAVYVATDGSDQPACGASTDPCKTVQYGIEQARLSTSDDITVHIATGTYTETVDIGIWPTGRSLTLDGAGASSTTIDANSAGTVLSLGGGSVVVRDLTLTGGNSASGGGGIRTNGDLRLDRVEVVDNTSDAGGGAFVGGGSLTITSSTLAENTGDLAGGGALFVSGGVVSIATSTLTGNNGPGAAIFNSGGTVTVSASTLAANGPDNGRNAIVRLGGTTTIESSILSDTGCEALPVDGGHNVTSDDSCGFDPANNTVGSVDEIGLAPLGDFGGPTRTMPPKSFSLAAFPSDNRVPAGSAGCPASAGTDQRGVARPKDDGCDVGAVELAPTTLQAALVSGKLTATATSATSVPADLPALAGAVTFAQAYRTLTGCEQVPVDTSGHMSCTPDSLVGTLYSTFESTNGFAYSRDVVSGIDSIALSPSSGSIGSGDAQAYMVTGHDAGGASLGDVTSSATLTISPDGSCVGARCTPAKTGVHTVTASLDGLTDQATLVATAPPVVSTQPGDQAVTDGEDATFEAAASGYPVPTVQWQRSTGDGHWADIDGGTSTTLVLAHASALLDGTAYRAVFTNSVGAATTDPATLSVRAAASPTDPPAADPASDAPASAGPAATLARTGPVGLLELTLAGLLLVAAGVCLLAAVRNRRRPI